MRTKIISALLLIICLAWTSISAQQSPPVPKTYKLAVQMKGLHRPSHPLPVPGSTSLGGVDSLSGGEALIDGQPVASINFKTVRDGDEVKINLLLTLDNGKEIAVATYRARENETVLTSELTKYDIAPLELKIVRDVPLRYAPPPATTPEVNSQVEAIEVVSVEKKTPTIFVVSLRNVSSKSISTIFIDAYTRQVKGGYIEQNRTPLAPGEIHKTEIDFTQVKVETSANAVPPAEVYRAEIGTVIFEDGSYEGEAFPVVMLDAARRAREIQRERVIALLEKAREDTKLEPAAALERLKEAAYALRKDAEVTVISEIASRYTSIPAPPEEMIRSAVEGGLFEIKSRLLIEIKAYESSLERAREKADFRTWLGRTKEMFEKLDSADRH